ncbi:gastrula zinc finger protein XlCGF52.1-like [Phycodurus eques]|uniref:gastrula zinc finger protein XlCGF52.1-like n=1 Tax=Phycodurus eques TaxID=693459 RepID=UPI002ACE60D5|nr:gastrula zinc finger protein XlCGF52.1-like [Phycodurus eques]
MLKVLIRERLAAAADEIFGLFERTITSYEEQLCRAREESERHRRQLEAVHKTHTVICGADLQQVLSDQGELPARPHPQPSHVKVEEKAPQPIHIKEEEEHPQATQVKEAKEDLAPLHVKEEEEADVNKFPLTGVSAESDDDEDKTLRSSQLHRHSPSGDHCGGPPPGNLLAPLSDSDDIEEPLRSNADCEGDDKRSKCSESETTWKMKTSQTQMRTGTQDNIFSCSLCSKIFRQRTNLVSHMRTHTGEKPFSCSFCGQRFTQKTNMVKHLRTHTGEKPFSCSICLKRFTVKSTMVKHMRTHTGEKPFSCPTCGRKFSHRAAMVIHIRTHTGEKPFHCTTCGRTFSHRAAMVRHIRTHIGE